MFAARFLQQNNRQQKKQFDSKRDDAAARSRQKQSPNGQKSKEADDEAPLAPDFSQNEGNKRDRNGQFRKSREMISIDVGSERNSAVMHFAKPIKLPIEREVLKNSKARHKECKEHHEPEKSAPVLQRTERLRSEKNHAEVCQQELKLNPRIERRSGGAENPLNCNDTSKRKQRRQNCRQDNFLFPVKRKEKSPNKKKETRAGFKNSDSPVFNTSVSQNAKNQKRADRDAKRPHRFLRSGVAGSKETSSIQAAPCMSPSGNPLGARATHTL